ncbi:DDE-type integrase/transposase/recombinase [Sutcliffiella sp. NC1]|uniref:DDE-type integrase/transposase/recombinase n=1 Tax=Sutcliffiella sp. NC1 TaxID=3004096 RepID=UPI0022DCEF5D|nr:DDE-type integrase/transposase/recombinase [Sutcliffiella sp. NC1]WBL16870.1 DDE-type integrase/transposase/recombinase [Sutcliffiella sp. NC1]
MAENTVRNYVNDLWEFYHISKVSVPRTYSAVPIGKQAQVDFGQTNVKNTNGESKRLYFIAFILTHSRYKYVEWLDRPFRTSDVLRMQENAFDYFEGMPEEKVYDQDALINAEFTNYQKARHFNIYLCRKSDPESKRED